MGITTKYDRAIDLSSFTVIDDDKNEIMHSLNVKQNELLIMQYIVCTQEKNPCIFSVREVLMFEEHKLQKHYINQWQDTMS